MNEFSDEFLKKFRYEIIELSFDKFLEESPELLLKELAQISPEKPRNEFRDEFPKVLVGLLLTKFI